MNRVKDFEKPESKRKYKLGNLILECGGTETAFIGCCGAGPEHSLYNITCDRIFLADNPKEAWTHEGCPVIIDRFVDIEIEVIEKETTTPEVPETFRTGARFRHIESGEEYLLVVDGHGLVQLSSMSDGARWVGSYAIDNYDNITHKEMNNITNLTNWQDEFEFIGYGE